jgi:hypothetical protein
VANENEIPSNESANKRKRSTGPLMGVTLVLGTAIGAAIGAATDDMGTWLALGVAIGVAFGGVGTVVRNRRDKQQ